MVHGSDREGDETPIEAGDAIAEIATDLIGEVAFPGVPAPVKRNLLKATGQLLTAAVEVPAAYLTGIADEQRAMTAARVKLIQTFAEQTAGGMETDPEYAQVAIQKFGQRVLREQVNLDLVGRHAINEVVNNSDPNHQSDGDEPEDDGSGGTIDDDWLNAFETEARLKSSEEMQMYFGKVLAGEIMVPGSFSKLSVKTLASIDRDAAEKFVLLCSMSIAFPGAFRVSSLGGHAGTNALQDYGLNFEALNLLNEHGLVIADFNSWQDFMPCVRVPGRTQQIVCVPLSYQGKHWILIPQSDNKIGSMLRIDGVNFTQVGRELAKIVTIEVVGDYSSKLIGFFATKGYRMAENVDGNPRVLIPDANGSFDHY